MCGQDSSRSPQDAGGKGIDLGSICQPPPFCRICIRCPVCTKDSLCCTSSSPCCVFSQLHSIKRRQRSWLVRYQQCTRLNPDAASKHKHMETPGLLDRTHVLPLCVETLSLVPSTSVVPKANFCRVGSGRCPSTRTGTDDGNTVCPTTEELLTRQCGKDRSKRKQ
jgi:hypothetical protein